MNRAPAAYCRDCLRDTGDETARAEDRCRHCGSPRLIVLAGCEALSIAHIDCDAFYAAVEKRDDPSLRDLPVIVGGGQRGVVSTCCYIARTFGVRSAMPIFQARRLCPEARIVKPDMSRYVAVGRQVRALMLDLTPLVEPLSIDEAFLDLSGTDRLHGASPAVTLARLAARIERDIGITVSVGLSYCKFLAKIASDLDKPRGFSVIGRSGVREFLADRPLDVIWGVGRVAQERLRREGFATIGDLQKAGEADILRRLGAEGGRLWRLANGIDLRPVSPARDAKSVSSETTFESDISDPATLERTLLRLSEKVGYRLKAAGIAGKTVTLKLKTHDFRQRTRARALSQPTQLTTRIFEAGRDLLVRECDGTRFRLIGIGLGDLCPAGEADRGDLVDTGVERVKATEAAIDSLRAKFGRDAIVRGLEFGGQQKHPRR